jgi:heat shock protein HslJ
MEKEEKPVIKMVSVVVFAMAAVALAACATAVPTPEPTALPTALPTEAAPLPTVPPADPLAGTRWSLATLNGTAPISGTQVSLNFGTDGSFAGSDGCNRYNASYVADGTSLTITSPIAGTMMACEEAVMKQATDYTGALASVTAFAVVSETLTLTGVDGADLLTFAAQSQELAGTTWSATGYNNGQQAVVSVAAGTQVTVTFGTDGMLSGFAGCNNYAGPYEAGKGTIAIGALASQRMACPEPAMSQETQYLAALPTAATYTIEADALELRTADGAIAATYQSVPAE